MTEYKKFLVKQQSYNGVNYADIGSIVDTYTAYGILCQEFPFKYLPERKELAKREWPDENGEDVFFPTDGAKFKAYDLEVSFLYIGSIADMHTNILGFIDFITGKNNSSVQCIAIYDEYTQIGLRGVYVLDVSDDLYDYNDVNIQARAIFKVKFRVTDPVTRLNSSLEVIQ